MLVQEGYYQDNTIIQRDLRHDMQGSQHDSSNHYGPGS
jgi:hypothetical protein